MAIETTDVQVTNPLLETKPRTTKTELGKNDFLQLLTKQLQYQDPLKPVENTEFVAQMAQFSSLEQMTNMNASLEKFANAANSSYKVQAMSLLGATVTGKTADQAEATKGVVESVKFADGVATFRVGGKDFKLDEISEMTYE